MSTPEGSEHIQPGRLNKTAIAAIVLPLVAVSGVWLFGAAVLAVFAVGAGHVALDQIKRKGEGAAGWQSVLCASRMPWQYGLSGIRSCARPANDPVKAESRRQPLSSPTALDACALQGSELGDQGAHECAQAESVRDHGLDAVVPPRCRRDIADRSCQYTALLVEGVDDLRQHGALFRRQVNNDLITQILHPDIDLHKSFP